MIKDIFWKDINTHLPKNLNRVVTGILSYFDRYSNIFSTTSLIHRPLFTDADRNVIYMAVGIDENSLLKVIKESETFHSDRIVSSNPFYVMCFLCAHWCYVNKKPKETSLILQYMAADTMYSSIHYKYLSLNCVEAVMSYTANNIEGTKLSEDGSLGRMIKSQIDQCIDTYGDRLKKATDEDIQYFIAAVSTRMNNRLRPVFSAYYRFKANGAYLNHETEDNSEENFRGLDNDLFMIDRHVTGIYLDISNGKINRNIYNYAMSASGISSTKCRMLIDDIIQDESPETMRKYLSSIIEYFHYYSKHSLSDINTNVFSATMMSAYSSSTTSEHMNFIKDTMDDWLNKYAGSGGTVRYNKTSQMAYKKAIYTFFVYLIKTHRM